MDCAGGGGQRTCAEIATGALLPLLGWADEWCADSTPASLAPLCPRRQGSRFARAGGPPRGSCCALCCKTEQYADRRAAVPIGLPACLVCCCGCLRGPATAFAAQRPVVSNGSRAWRCLDKLIGLSRGQRCFWRRPCWCWKKKESPLWLLASIGRGLDEALGWSEERPCWGNRWR